MIEQTHVKSLLAVMLLAAASGCSLADDPADAEHQTAPAHLLDGAAPAISPAKAAACMIDDQAECTYFDHCQWAAPVGCLPADPLDGAPPTEDKPLDGRFEGAALLADTPFGSQSPGKLTLAIDQTGDLLAGQMRLVVERPKGVAALDFTLDGRVLTDQLAVAFDGGECTAVSGAPDCRAWNTWREQAPERFVAQGYYADEELYFDAATARGPADGTTLIDWLSAGPHDGWKPTTD